MSLLFIGVFLFGFMLLGFFALSRKRNREQKQEPELFPPEWKAVLEKEIAYFGRLSSEEKAFFCKRMMAFLAEVNIEAVHFEITDRDKILVAASAVIPIFHFGDWHYNNLDTVLIYPDYFDEDLNFTGSPKKRNIGGLVGTGRFKNHMILSRKALHHGFSNKTDKGNTAIHEFVHLLDMMDGDVDGIPEQLLGRENMIPWLQLMHKEMEKIHKDKSDIRSYGGTNQAEFFAVAAEYFFERPKLFKRKHPDIYKMLHLCFIEKS